MPVRKRLQTAPVAEVDAVSAFRWSFGDGLSHALGYPCFKTRAEAERAWQRVRREVWAKTPRFSVPRTSMVYDGLTTNGRDFVLDHWNHLGAFDLAGALDALAVDRANLEAFERTRAARSIGDYLDLFRGDLDTIEQTARSLAAVADHEFRPCPHHFYRGGVYGDTATQEHSEKGLV